MIGGNNMKRFLYLAVLLCVFSACGRNSGSDQYVIGFYNLENLFDTYDDPQKNDEDFLPEGRNGWTEDKYQKKLANMATVIAEMAKENGCWHTVLGVCEIENSKVLDDLTAHELIKDAGFEFVHHEGPDRRGIDVALLYRPSQFDLLETESLPYTFEGSSIDFIMPKEEQDDFRTRDVLMAHGLIDGEHFAFYVAHLPSRAGDKKGSNQLRDRGAEIMYDHAMMMQKKYPGIKIVCMGDMNDNPVDPSMVEYLHGKESLEGMTEEDFYNPFVKMLKAGQGSLSYRNVWNIYDLILVNNALADTSSKDLHIIDNDADGFYAKIFNRDFLTNQEGKYKGTPYRTFSGGKFIGGYSDHYPTYIVIGSN